VTTTTRLILVGVVNLALVAVCAIVGATAHSAGLWSEALDYLADAAAISVSILAIRLASRHPRAPIVAAGVNAGWLLVLSLLVIGGSIVRLASGVGHVDGLAVLVVSAVAALAMTAGAALLDQDDDDLNRRAVLLDTVADAAAAAGVAIAGAVILIAHSWYWLDPAAALAISLVIAYHAVKSLHHVVHHPTPGSAESTNLVEDSLSDRNEQPPSPGSAGPTCSGYTATAEKSP
jgi:cobalt-zinc-cadmium efflux system protein